MTVWRIVAVVVTLMGVGTLALGAILLQAAVLQRWADRDRRRAARRAARKGATGWCADDGLPPWPRGPR